MFILIVLISFASGANDRFFNAGKENELTGLFGMVGELLVDNGDEWITCSGTFVNPTGLFLTALHCFRDPWVCDFSTSDGYYLLWEGTYQVDVNNVNRTTAKWTFNAEIVGWSGQADLILLQLDTLYTEDGGDIALVNQPFMAFGNTSILNRGNKLQTMTFDEAVVKKTTRGAVVQVLNKDHGSGFSTSVEHIFIESAAQEGSSGGAAFNSQRQIMMAPITYGWSDDGVWAISGTSGDVSRVLTNLITTTEANGPSYNFLMPSLGIVVFDVFSGIDNYQNFDLGRVQNTGLYFQFLAVQDFYDFLTGDVFECGFDPYEVYPPSILDAPLVATISGTPPDPFPDFAGNTKTKKKQQQCLICCFCF